MDWYRLSQKGLNLSQKSVTDLKAIKFWLIRSRVRLYHYLSEILKFLKLSKSEKKRWEFSRIPSSIIIRTSLKMSSILSRLQWIPTFTLLVIKPARILGRAKRNLASQKRMETNFLYVTANELCGRKLVDGEISQRSAWSSPAIKATPTLSLTLSSQPFLRKILYKLMNQ